MNETARSGSSDTAPPDTGPPDTGPPDTGPPDPGPPDTGPPDPGPPDTGPPDPRPPDPGLPAEFSGLDPDSYVQPAIPVSAGALIFDHVGRLLILKPTYKSGWTIPGGVMEADGETPWQACQREVREECGIELGSGRLACMDFRLPRDGNPGGIRFLFDCGTLDDAAFLDIILQEEEISAHRLVPMPEALTLLRGPIRRRVKAVRTRHGKVRKHPVRYLENGRKVPGVHR